MAAKKKTPSKKKSAKKVSFIPKGYATVSPVMCQSDATATIAFCKKVLGAKLRLSMPAPGGKVAHAEMQIGDSVVMISDAMMDPPRVSSLFLYVPNVDKVIAKMLAAGSKIRMPAADMFWGDRFGSVIDPFGNIWGFATHFEDVSPSEMKKRQKEAMKQMAPQMAPPPSDA